MEFKHASQEKACVLLILDAHHQVWVCVCLSGCVDGGHSAKPEPPPPGHRNPMTLINPSSSTSRSSGAALHSALTFILLPLPLLPHARNDSQLFAIGAFCFLLLERGNVPRSIALQMAGSGKRSTRGYT